MDYSFLNDKACIAILRLLEEAGRCILKHYHSKTDTTHFKADLTPVTAADLESHAILTAGLVELFPWACLSEEGRVGAYHPDKPFWVIDPLDGTKDFIARTGEFCINVSLVHHHKAIAGFIHAPVEAVTHYAVAGKAYRYQRGNTERLKKIAPHEPLRFIASRQHPDQMLYKKAIVKKVEWLECGSALKFARIAEGKADLCIRLEKLSSWDIAAGVALLEACKGAVCTLDHAPISFYWEKVTQAPFYATCCASDEKVQAILKEMLEET